MTIEEPQPPSRLGCLCTILGCLAGAFLGIRGHVAVIEAIRAKDPTAFIDFLPVYPFLGFVAGGLLGAFIGRVAELFILPRSSDQ